MTGETKEIEAQEKLRNFAVYYFYAARVRLQNASMLVSLLSQKNMASGTELELAVSYVNYATFEFASSLYDAIQVLKGLHKLKGIDPPYSHPKSGPIASMMKFRRNIVAHRGANWGSPESVETLKWARDIEGVIAEAHQSAEEFVSVLKQEGISLRHDQRPNVFKFRMPELKATFSAPPSPGQWMPIFSEDELKAFFGEDAFPRSR